MFRNLNLNYPKSSGIFYEDEDSDKSIQILRSIILRMTSSMPERVPLAALIEECLRQNVKICHSELSESAFIKYFPDLNLVVFDAIKIAGRDENSSIVLVHQITLTLNSINNS